MNELLVLFNNQIKNVWQYLCFAICGILCIKYRINKDYYYFIFMLSLVSGVIIEKIVKYMSTILRQKQLDKKILFNLKHLNKEEVSFVIECLSTNSQTYYINNFIGLCKSLSNKGIAIYSTGIVDITSIPLTITQQAWKIIEKNRDELLKEWKTRGQ